MTETGKRPAVRLDSGVLLPVAIEKACEEQGLEFCDVTGFGELDWVELSAPDSDGAARYEGPFTLLDLRGRIRRAGGVVLSEFVCTVSRWTDNGVQVLGGGLVGGKARYLELGFVPLSSVDLTAAPPASVERKKAPRREPTARDKGAAASGPTSGKWAEALAESRRMEREGHAARWDEGEVEVPSRGDVVNHLQFGRCTVVKVTDEHIALKKPEGRVVQLGLSILRFSRVAQDDGGPATFDVQIQKG